MEIIKKIFAFLAALPAFSGLFKKAATSGKLEPVEVLNALSSISPDTKKITTSALDIANKGGNVQDVANAIKNIGEIEVLGQKVDTRTITQDLRKSGGFLAALANIIDKMQNQSPQEIVDLGSAASDLNNWNDIIKNVKG